MNIILSYNETDSYLQRSRLLWKNTAQRQYRAVLLLLVIGVLLMLAGLFGSDTFRSDLNKGTSLNNLNLSFSFGISIAFLGLAFLNALHKNKKKFLTAVAARIKRAEVTGNTNTTITITDASITASDFEITMETKWSAFEFYKINAGYVLLFLYQNAPTHLIEFDSMTVDERKAFETFLKENLQLKK